MANDIPTNRSNLVATARVSKIIRLLPGNRAVVEGGIMVDIPRGMRGVNIDISVVYVMGGPGVNTGFARIIALD